MRDINLKVTNEQIRKTKTRRHRPQYGGYQRERGEGAIKGKGGQTPSIHGDRR